MPSLKDIYAYWALNRILKSTLLTALLSNSKHHDLALGNIKDQCHGYCVKLNTVIMVLQFHYEPLKVKYTRMINKCTTICFELTVIMQVLKFLLMLRT